MSLGISKHFTKIIRPALNDCSFLKFKEGLVLAAPGTHALMSPTNDKLFGLRFIWGKHFRRSDVQYRNLIVHANANAELRRLCELNVWGKLAVVEVPVVYPGTLMEFLDTLQAAL
ncbi:hypothetical protein OF83DRAFT_1088276 [Amylostereum chailletii]|nr:hypothetical protein OF83DRAFT_1088276 [Amylostereum chailletii]